MPAPAAPHDAASAGERFGDWTADLHEGVSEARTANASGATFGLLCGDECIFYLDLGTACEANRAYSGTVASVHESFPIALTCRRVGDVFVFTTAATGDYEDLIGNCPEVGFAIDGTAGGPTLARFSLAGAREAIAAAIEAAGSHGQRRALPDTSSDRSRIV